MLTQVKDLEYKTLNMLSDKDLVNYCRINKQASKICDDQMFWLNRILIKFPYIPIEILKDNKGDRTWSEYYIKDLRKIITKQSIDILYKGGLEGRTDYILIALHLGADINDSHFSVENNVLMAMASTYGRLVARKDDYFKTVKLLIDKGINVNHRNYYGSAPLMAYVINFSPEVIKLLLDAKANPNNQNDNGETVLMVAAKGLYEDTIKLLLDYGADKSLEDNKGKRAYDYTKLLYNTDDLKLKRVQELLK